MTLHNGIWFTKARSGITHTYCLALFNNGSWMCAWTRAGTCYFVSYALSCCTLYCRTALLRLEGARLHSLTPGAPLSLGDFSDQSNAAMRALGSLLQGVVDEVRVAVRAGCEEDLMLLDQQLAGTIGSRCAYDVHTTAVEERFAICPSVCSEKLYLHRYCWADQLSRPAFLSDFYLLIFGDGLTVRLQCHDPPSCRSGTLSNPGMQLSSEARTFRRQSISSAIAVVSALGPEHQDARYAMLAARRSEKRRLLAFVRVVSRQLLCFDAARVSCGYRRAQH